jgi:diacylglycerol kinase
MKIHMAAILVVIATGFYLSFSYVDWSLSILAIGLVIGLEVLNTSIEELVNFVSPEKREIAGRIKDLAAGAVLAASIAAFVVGLLIVISKL